MSNPASPSVGGPIVVNKDPLKDQLEAGIRQLLLALGAIAAAFGFAKYAGVLNILVANSGAIAGLVGGVIAVGSAIYGQIKTRAIAEKAATMADKLPNDVAVTK